MPCSACGNNVPIVKPEEPVVEKPVLKKPVVENPVLAAQVLAKNRELYLRYKIARYNAYLVSRKSHKSRKTLLFNQ